MSNGEVEIFFQDKRTLAVQLLQSPNNVKLTEGFFKLKQEKQPRNYYSMFCASLSECKSLKI